MIDLDELERMLAEATPGPWKTEHQRAESVDKLANAMAVSIRKGGSDWHWLETQPYSGTWPAATGNGPTSEANARLIAALRNAAPELIAATRERDALRQRVSDLRFALGDNAGWFDRARKAEAERDDWACHYPGANDQFIAALRSAAALLCAAEPDYPDDCPAFAVDLGDGRESVVQVVDFGDDMPGDCIVVDCSEYFGGDVCCAVSALRPLTIAAAEMLDAMGGGT